jgi:hypothetical protein
MSMGGPPDVGAILSSRKKLQTCLDECVARYPINTKKLAVLGFSQGGVMAYKSRPVKPRAFCRFSGAELLAAQRTHSTAFHQRSRSIAADTGTAWNAGPIEVQRARDSVEKLRALRVPAHLPRV